VRVRSPLQLGSAHGGVFALAGAVKSVLLSAVALLCARGLAQAGPYIPAPPLPPPSGAVVHVSTTAELESAVASIGPHTTIVLAPGAYALDAPLVINGGYADVGIRGATNNRDDVVLVGKGMNGPEEGATPFGIWVGGNVRGVTIANLTIRDVYQHAIVFNAGVESPLIHNVRLVNAGQQLIKANPDGAGGGVDEGIVQYSVIEYDTTSRDHYTNGVDVHTGDNWIIRHNLFRNIRAPQGLAGPAILMWNASTNSLVDGNTFMNCQREIALGLIERTLNDHSGGIVRNNFIYRSVPGDAAISVADSPNTQVLHNTILISGTYPNPIEYRFADTTGVTIANNALDGAIASRDGAAATVTGNYTTATVAMFMNAPAGDLHVAADATELIDRVTVVPVDAALDWDGHPRPAGSADIGADEYRADWGPAPPRLRITGSS
jgi:hypothetical protein